MNFSDKPRPREPLYPETEYKLFVGNLAWSVTSESLTQAFQEYGNVVGARVLYDGETGRSRGYGFVCYSTKSEMDAALESLNGVVFPLFPSSLLISIRHILDQDSCLNPTLIGCVSSHLTGTRRPSDASQPGAREAAIAMETQM